ncbi:MAG: hypothetical protein ACOC9Z_06970 [Chloroflexota bacterium]
MSDAQGTPHIGDAELLAYLDGDAEEEVVEQIERSTVYQERLKELKEQERRLRALLYRGTCPDAHELGQFELKMLGTERAALVAQHVDSCPRCAMELEELHDFLKDVAPDLEYSLLERVRILIARLAPDPGRMGGDRQPMPALAGVRGADNGPLIYETDGVQVSLEVQDDAGGAGRKSVLGLVTGAEPNGWQATLWQEDGPLAEMVQTQEIDELGNFILEGLLPGTYSLTLRGEEVEVVVQELVVK